MTDKPVACKINNVRKDITLETAVKYIRYEHDCSTRDALERLVVSGNIVPITGSIQGRESARVTLWLLED